MRLSSQCFGQNIKRREKNYSKGYSFTVGVSPANSESVATFEVVCIFCGCVSIATHRDVYPISNCGEWFATNIFFTLPSMLVVHFAWRAEPTKTSTASFESNHKFMYIKLITMRTCRGKNNIAWRMSWRKKKCHGNIFHNLFCTVCNAFQICTATRMCREKAAHRRDAEKTV